MHIHEYIYIYTYTYTYVTHTHVSAHILSKRTCGTNGNAPNYMQKRATLHLNHEFNQTIPKLTFPRIDD